MKVAPGIDQIELRNISEPSPGPGQAKLKVHAAGLSELDLLICQDELSSSAPVTLGHEVAGEVVEVGQDVSPSFVGRRVTSETRFHPYSSRSMDSTTSGIDRHSTGSELHGAFAEYLVVPAQNLHRLPEKISYREGALTAPLACAVHTVLLNSPTVRAGDLAVISGPSTIGLLTLQILKASHATVVMLGTSEDSDRLTLANDLGADYTVNVEKRDIHALIQDVSLGGLGADVVYECSGDKTTAHELLHLVRRRGRYVQMGLFGTSVTWDLDQICYKEILVTGGSVSTPESWTRAIHLLKHGIVETGPLITHDFMLSQWESALNVFQQKNGIKVLFRPHFDGIDSPV